MPENGWLESRLNKDVRVYLAVINSKDKFETQHGILESVEERGIVVGGKWFNMTQIAVHLYKIRSQRTTVKRKLTLPHQRAKRFHYLTVSCL